MVCTTCHNPHGSTNVKQLRAGNYVNEACYSCHAEKRGPFLWEHAAGRESCTTCHDPHGSNNDRMLVARTPMLCQRCHIGTRHPSTIYDGTSLGAAEQPPDHARLHQLPPADPRVEPPVRQCLRPVTAGGRDAHESYRTARRAPAGPRGRRTRTGQDHRRRARRSARSISAGSSPASAVTRPATSATATCGPAACSTRSSTRARRTTGCSPPPPSTSVPRPEVHRRRPELRSREGELHVGPDPALLQRGGAGHLRAAVGDAVHGRRHGRVPDQRRRADRRCRPSARSRRVPPRRRRPRSARRALHVHEPGGGRPRHPAAARRRDPRRDGEPGEGHQPPVPLPEHVEDRRDAVVGLLRLRGGRRPAGPGRPQDDRRRRGRRVGERQGHGQGRLGRVLVHQQRQHPDVGQPAPRDRLHLLVGVLARGRHLAGPHGPLARQLDEHVLGHGDLQAAEAQQGLREPRASRSGTRTTSCCRTRSTRRSRSSRSTARRRRRRPT